MAIGTRERVNRMSAMTVIRFLLLAVGLGAASCGVAGQTVHRCVDEAAQRFGHDPKLLSALVQIESGGKCIAIHPVMNANKTYDIGCLGINSAWLPLLQKKFGFTESDLYEPCNNIHVGAWVLAKNIRLYGNTWRAVGAYNARTESKRMEYAWRVSTKLVQSNR